MIRYFYETESNHYAMNVQDNNAVRYVRSGVLHHIDYGLHEACVPRPGCRAVVAIDSHSTAGLADSWAAINHRRKGPR